MARSQNKPSSNKSLPTSPLRDDEIDAFLTDVEEAREYRDALERSRYDLSPTESVARMTNLPLARQRLTELEGHLAKLRGDMVPTSPATSAPPNTIAALPDGRMRIQAEAWEHWVRLKAAGANPTIHSICETMAQWCADNNVTTHTGVTPRAGTIRNTILGGSSGWVPPTLSRDQAKEHVARLAQVAQPDPPNPR